MTEKFSHTTVMLYEAVEGLAIKEDGIYIDGTFGRGGHSKLILSKLGEKGRLIAFDRDIRAIETAKEINDPRFTIIHAPFSTMASTLEELNLIGKVDGVLLDLGVSSPQLDDASRGFSFMRNGPLDMRMDQTSGLSAREYLFQASEADIAKVLWQYGEEKNSRQIARAIVNLRNEVAYEAFLPDTESLVELVKKSSHFKDKNKNPATRTFQAIRIEVNGELRELETLLESSVDFLSPGGRLSIISFHSLEDRIVKQFFKEKAKGTPIPKNLPIMDSEWDSGIVFATTSKAIKPSKEEVAVNVRSRSAILRWAEKK